MQAVVFSFTRNGAALSIKLQTYLAVHGYATEIKTMSTFADISPLLQIISPNIKMACSEAFRTSRVIIFIGAAGIAVRSIAPFLKSKDKDPAVIVIDERGNYVIPILSGHLGGANDLAVKLAAFLKAEAVVTTATDVNNLFAVDEWAARNNLQISSLKTAKAISAALVDGKTIGLASDFPLRGELPAGIKLEDTGPLGISVSLFKNKKPFTETLVLRPRILHLGIGCRRNVDWQDINNFVMKKLNALKLNFSLLAGAASINLKKEEKGLLQFARENSLPLQFYTVQQLKLLPGSYTASDFVLKTVGVDNVCERAAVFDSGGGRLLLKKTAENDITLAIACENLVLYF